MDSRINLSVGEELVCKLKLIAHSQKYKENVLKIFSVTVSQKVAVRFTVSRSKGEVRTEVEA